MEEFDPEANNPYNLLALTGGESTLLGDGVSLASDLTSSLRFVGATLDRWSLGLSVDLRFGFGE